MEGGRKQGQVRVSRSVVSAGRGASCSAPPVGTPVFQHGFRLHLFSVSQTITATVSCIHILDTPLLTPNTTRPAAQDWKPSNCPSIGDLLDKLGMLPHDEILCSKKIKNRAAIRSRNSTSGYLTKKTIQFKRIRAWQK